MAEGVGGTAGRGGITMLDGAALVTGAAVASVHFRESAGELESLTPLGWGLVGFAFAWLALTAAGPFVFLVRRFSRRPAAYPEGGDLLWLAFGLPWLVAALYASAAGAGFDPAIRLYSRALFAGLLAATALGLVQLARGWSRLDASSPSGMSRPSWTATIGRAVSVAWPLQIGLGLVLTK